MIYVELAVIIALAITLDRMCKRVEVRSGRYIGAFLCIWISAELMGYAIGKTLQLSWLWLNIVSLCAGLVGGMIVFFGTKRQMDALKKQKDEQQRLKLED